MRGATPSRAWGVLGEAGKGEAPLSRCCLVPSGEDEQASDCSGEMEQRRPAGGGAERAALGTARGGSGARLQAAKEQNRDRGRIHRGNFGKEKDACCPEGEFVIKRVCS